MSYIAFVLSEQSQKDLIALFPPNYERTICHHITLHFGKVDDETIQSVLEYHGDQGQINPFHSFIVVGHYDDGRGIECLKVANVTFLGDEYHSPKENTKRMDGGVFHITHSIGIDRKPVHSNEVVNKEKNLIRNIRFQITGSVQVME